MTTRITKLAGLALALTLSLPGCADSSNSLGPCSNGALDSGETAVDCGGACGLCPGEMCTQPLACASRRCIGQVCVVATCTDGIQNGMETGQDCGGPCTVCSLRPPTCSNNVRDPGETGVDCGGSCGPCAVELCANNVRDPGEESVDCGGTCAACATDTCKNGVLDPGETEIDCGGGCTPCGQTPTCSDGFRNQDETDLDCGGGTCSACGLGKGCGQGSDCQSSVCGAGTCAEPEVSCSNGKKDGSETDVDCGAGCSGCRAGQFCDGASDCLSATCIFGECRDPSCTDGMKNGNEADIDCGGPCNGCSAGAMCVNTADCDAGLVCGAGGCTSCTDEIQNGNETDTDCGGACDAKCVYGGGCTRASDCAEFLVCDEGSCALRPGSTVAVGTTAIAEIDNTDASAGFNLDTSFGFHLAQIQLYGANLLTSGDYVLTDAPNDNFATCTVCVVFRRDGQFFFQSGGAINLGPDSSDHPSQLRATLQGISIEEVTIDWEGGYTSTPVPGGRTFQLAPSGPISTP